MSRASSNEPLSVIQSESDLSMRYCPGIIDRIPFSAGKELLRSRTTGQARLVPSALSRSIVECGHFETLYDLAKKVYRTTYFAKNPEPDRKDTRGLSRLTNKWIERLMLRDQRLQTIISELNGLADAGLLISEASLLDGLQSSLIEKEGTKKIAALGIVTKNRPTSLRHCLSSYLEHCAERERAIEVAVMDDSSEPRTLISNRDMLAEMARSRDVSIFHASGLDKIRFADMLSRWSGVKKDTIDFALFGLPAIDYTAGANRNALLLHSVGDLILSVDDDTLCHTVETPSPDPRLVLRCQADPQEFWFFSDRKAAMEFAAKSDIDIFASHESLLGRTLSDIIASAPRERIDLQSLCESFLESLQQRGGSVVFTNNGLLGDCALSSSLTLLVHTSRQTQGRLMQSKQDYDLALQTREVLRVADSPHIIHGPPWSGTVMGLDNSRLLPPFVPTGRGEDVLFGFLITKCMPDAYFGHLPWALLHAPPTQREYLYSAVATADNLRVDDLMGVAIASFRARPGREATDRQLKDLGNYLKDISDLTDKGFREETIRLLLGQEAELIARIERLILDDEGPSFRADDMKSWIERRAIMWTNPDALFPQDTDEDFAAAWATAKMIMRRYGELLCAWPEVISAALQLRAKGIRIGQPL